MLLDAAVAPNRMEIHPEYVGGADSHADRNKIKSLKETATLLSPRRSKRLMAQQRADVTATKADGCVSPPKKSRRQCKKAPCVAPDVPSHATVQQAESTSSMEFLPESNQSEVTRATTNTNFVLVQVHSPLVVRNRGQVP